MIDPRALLDRVEVALAAQAELAARTAARRAAEALALSEQSRVLRGHMRRQAALMGRLMGERRELQAQFRGPAGRLDRVLAEPRAHGSGGLRVVDVLLPRDVSCAAVARRLLADHLNGDFDRQAIGDALLIATELVFNALVHGSGTIEMRAAVQDGRLRVEVSDQGEPEWIGVSRADQNGGRGLWLVDQLSSAWGATTRPARVWAELPLSGSEMTTDLSP